VDPFFGVQDIEEGLIRTPLNPDISFEDDVLRIMRAGRFCAQLGFQLESWTADAIRKAAPAIQKLAIERVGEELLKAAYYRLDKAIEIFQSLGVLQYILPELEACVGVQQRKEYHAYDVYGHTLAALRAYEGNDPIIALTLLLHDIAKPECFDERRRTIGHELRGAEVASEILRRLRFSESFIYKVSLLIKLHMRLHQGMTPRVMRHTAVLAETDEMLQRLIDITICDHKGKGLNLGTEDYYGTLRERVAKAISPGVPHKKNMPVNGDDIMETFHITSGPEVGKLLEQVQEYLLEDPSLTKEELLARLTFKRSLQTNTESQIVGLGTSDMTYTL
jgi:tRNA nucleotidyltransferase/poly(A) polymerase